MVRYDAYAHLSAEERFNRFCAIMAKAVYLAEERDRAKERPKEPVAKPEVAEKAAPKLPEFTGQQPVSDKIIDFLAEVGEASPRDIQNKYALSRSKTYRLLAELKQDGKIEQFGQTRSIRYRLVG